MTIKLNIESPFFKRIEKLYKNEEDRDIIINALFYVHHPLSFSFEKGIREKVAFAELQYLNTIGIKYEDLDKKGIIRLFVEDCIPAEVRAYYNLKMLFDGIMDNVSTKVAANTKALNSNTIKEYRSLLKDYSDMKEQLEKQRSNAREDLKLKTLGNEILGYRDMRSLQMVDNSS